MVRGYWIREADILSIAGEDQVAKLRERIRERIRYFIGDEGTYRDFADFFSPLMQDIEAGQKAYLKATPEEIKVQEYGGRWVVVEGEIQEANGVVSGIVSFHKRKELAEEARDRFIRQRRESSIKNMLDRLGAYFVDPNDDGVISTLLSFKTLKDIWDFAMGE